MFKITNKYATIVFDCDGVLLDSNLIKTTAFADVARQFGDEAADALQIHHIKNGGISRYKKFEYLLTEILGLKSADEKLIKKLTAEYSCKIQNKLLTCAIAPGLAILKEALPKTTWMVVSGSDELELRKILSLRGLSGLFDGGIYGSPADKDEIFSKQLASGCLQRPALFIGDSKYDYQSSRRAGIDFCFAYEWSELKEWKSYCELHQINFVKNVMEIKVNNISSND